MNHLDEDKAGSFPNGKKTQEKLKKLGIKSPSCNLIQLDAKTWIDRPSKITDKELPKWLEEKRKQLRKLL